MKPPFQTHRVVAGTLVVIVCLFALSSGCGIGTHRMLFVTNTSTGIDLDSTPPTVSIAYDRQEGIIAPQYPDGYVAPVIATAVTNTSANWLGFIPTFGYAQSQNYATGEAADILADSFGTKDERKNFPDNKKMELSAGVAPMLRDDYVYGVIPGLFVGLFQLLIGDKIDDAEIVPYSFATNTTVGLKVHIANSGMPRAINFGAKRQEIGLVYVNHYDSANGIQTTPTNNQKTSLERRVPALLAVMNAGAGVGVEDKTSKTRFQVGQIYATGTAAKKLAGNTRARETLLKPVFLGAETAAIIDKDVADAEKVTGNTREQVALGGEIYRLYDRLEDENDKTLIRKEVVREDGTVYVIHRLSARDAITSDTLSEASFNSKIRIPDDRIPDRLTGLRKLKGYLEALPKKPNS
jgi:hypothetical protein